MVIIDEKSPICGGSPTLRLAPACRTGNVSASAKFPQGRALLPHHGLADAITSDQIFAAVTAAELLRGDGVTAGTWEEFRRDRSDETSPVGFPFFSNGFCSHMDNLSGYAHRPFPFVLRYLRQRLASHVVILAAVIAAVACSVGTQYGVKYLVDGLSAGADPCRRRMAGIHFPHVPDRGRQFPVADRELDRELHICGSDRRSCAATSSVI